MGDTGHVVRKKVVQCPRGDARALCHVKVPRGTIVCKYATKNVLWCPSQTARQQHLEEIFLCFTGQGSQQLSFCQSVLETYQQQFSTGVDYALTSAGCLSFVPNQTVHVKHYTT